jgi:putative redox protein
LQVAKPPITATLTWQGDLRFRAATPRTEIILDSDGTAGPSPVDAVALALAGCMAIDVTDILIKGRHPLASLEASIAGERREEPPRRFLRFTLTFVVGGAVPEHAIQRALDLSREKYCSVWHSLREDIELETRFEVSAAPFDSGSTAGGR